MLMCGAGVNRGERSGLEKESGVKGKAGTGNVKCEGDRDGRADELGKALSNGAEDGGPPSLPLSTLEDELLLLTGRGLATARGLRELQKCNCVLRAWLCGCDSGVASGMNGDE